jgi:HSP20 family protein
VETIRTIRLRWSQGTLYDLTSHLVQSGFPQFAPAPWQPAINAYRCEDGIQICVELAGVDKSEIDLTVQERHLSIRGVRDVPEPKTTDCRTLQTIAMEIDYGVFQRDIRLPVDVDVDRIHADQKNGLLWIHLPLKKS